MAVIDQITRMDGKLRLRGHLVRHADDPGPLVENLVLGIPKVNKAEGSWLTFCRPELNPFRPVIASTHTVGI